MRQDISAKMTKSDCATHPLNFRTPIPKRMAEVPEMCTAIPSMQECHLHDDRRSEKRFRATIELSSCLRMDLQVTSRWVVELLQASSWTDFQRQSMTAWRPTFCAPSTPRELCREQNDRQGVHLPAGSSALLRGAHTSLNPSASAAQSSERQRP